MKNESNENQVLYKSSIESTNQQNKLIKKKLLFLLGKCILILLLSFFIFYVIKYHKISIFSNISLNYSIFFVIKFIFFSSCSKDGIPRLFKVFI